MQETTPHLTTKHSHYTTSHQTALKSSQAKSSQFKYFLDTIIIHLNTFKLKNNSCELNQIKSQSLEINRISFSSSSR